MESFEANSRVNVRVSSKKEEAFVSYRIAIIFMIVFMSTQASGTTTAKRQRVAILDFTNHAGLKEQESLYISDLVRSDVRGVLSTSSYIIMTRDNILELLPSDISMSDCIG